MLFLPGEPSNDAAWRAQCLPRLAARHEPSVYPAWRAPKPEFCTETIPSPACGGRGSHEKNARIFFMGAREGGRRPEGGNTNPVFMPLGGTSNDTAWRAQQPRHLAHCPIPNFVRKQSLPPLAGDGAPMKKMLAFFSWEPGKVAAGRKGGNKNPAFMPLGEPSIYTAWRVQQLRRLTACHEPSVYPAWRAPKPEFCTETIPSPAYGGRGSHEKNARIFFMGTREGGRRPEGGNKNPAFMPLDGPSNDAAWRTVQSRILHGNNPESCTETIPSPACGGRGSHEKNARIFFMGTREGGRRPEGGNKNPAFMPLDEPSNDAAWLGISPPATKKAAIPDSGFFQRFRLRPVSA